MERQRHHPAEFRLVAGGYMRTVGNVDDIAARLFAELVHRDEPHERRAKVLLHKVEKTLSGAQILPAQDVRVSAVWGDGAPEGDVKFDYSFTNGQVHLMERLQLHRPSRDGAKAVAREFNARVTAARAAGASNSFIAFYSSEAVEDMGGDSMLTPVFKVAHIVDVDNPEMAAGNLRQIMHG